MIKRRIKNMGEKIGFIGMGIMGVPMAKNILNKGYDLTVYNRTEEKCALLKEAGANICGYPSDLARDCDTVILMLTGPEAIDNVLGGSEGLLKGLAKGKCVINMSTVTPEYTEKINAEITITGADFIDSPVSGSKKPAEDAQLIILASGDKDVIESKENLFLAMGKKIVNCGEAGKGSAVKLANNMLLGIMMSGFAEAANLAESSGVSTETFLDVIFSGPLNNFLFQLKKDMFINEDFPPQFPFKHMEKDLRFAQKLADDTGAESHLGKLTASMFKNGLSRFAEEDVAAIKKFYK